ncbi:MAG: homoserine dehydrogenase [Chloroflexi bacterium]|nr:homoserine dehydrogenase [Chloroflexota bacterium]
MQPVQIALLGYGPVARDFIVLLGERDTDLRRRYGIALSVAGIRTESQEIILRPAATGPEAVPAREAWTPAGELGAFLTSSAASVAVQAIPSDDRLVDTATAQMLAAFDAGMDVVTATKTHLVRRWGVLAEAAIRTGHRVRISGATGAALPAADLARVSLRGFPCRAIRGSLNGTSSFVLEQLDAGGSLADAVRVAQSRGIAEADPTSDLDGRDAAAKLVLLANLLWGVGASIDAIKREPIDGSVAARAAAAARAGRRLRAVASADVETGRLEVGLEALEPGDPLFPLSGPEKAVAYDCGVVGQIVVSGGRSSPRGAAQAMLKDVLGLVLEAGPAGFD